MIYLAGKFEICLVPKSKFFLYTMHEYIYISNLSFIYVFLSSIFKDYI